MAESKTMEEIFRDIRVLNNAAGNTPMSPSDDNYWDDLKRQADLIQSELNETFDAIEERNLTKLRDGACDIEVTNKGLFHRGSIPYNEDMSEVINALYSRFCKTEQEAKETMEHYRTIEVETHSVNHEETGYIVILSSKDQKGTDGEDYPEGKWLKSIYRKKPQFDESLLG